MIRKEYLICYDIQEDKIRNSLHSYLLDYGLFSIQYSIFWGFLSLPEKNAVYRFLKKTIKEKDRIIFFPISLSDNPHLIKMGYEKFKFKDWKISDVI